MYRWRATKADTEKLEKEHDPNRYAGAIPYIIESRNDLFEKYKLSDSIRSANKLVFIDECDEIFRGLIVGEMRFYAKSVSIFYERSDKSYSVSLSKKRISGRNKILLYINENNMDGLLKMATEKGKRISGGGVIYLFTRTRKHRVF